MDRTPGLAGGHFWQLNEVYRCGKLSHWLGRPRSGTSPPFGVRAAGHSHAPTTRSCSRCSLFERRRGHPVRPRGGDYFLLARRVHTGCGRLYSRLQPARETRSPVAQAQMDARGLAPGRLDQSRSVGPRLRYRFLQRVSGRARFCRARCRSLVGSNRCSAPSKSSGSGVVRDGALFVGGSWPFQVRKRIC